MISTSINAALGMLFLGLAFASTFSMYQYWGYPYDKELRKSSCPQWKMNIHRGIGLAYLVVYVLLMSQMVPRLWTYQVEFPARTVAHIVFGVSIGVVLLIKLSILRFFRHFEEWMPVLGTLLLAFTILLSSLSLPFVFQERALARAAVGGSVVSAENLTRTRVQLGKIDFGEEVDLDALASEQSITDGREVLLGRCVYCHDLKTSIAKPRTPADWWRVVGRMASKPNLGPPLTFEAQQQVTAYLVAITPELQDSMQLKRKRRLAQRKVQAGIEKSEVEPDAGPSTPPPVVDMSKAKEVYEDLCSQCHELSDVDDDPPTTAAETKELIRRMIENDLEAEPEELELIEAYLNATFVAPRSE